MAKIEIEENVSELIKGLSAKVGKPRPLMEMMGRSLKTRTQLGFRLGVDPYGTAWKPLKFRAGQPLRDTGRLQRSMAYRASDTFVDIGTNTSYAVVHQFGATVKAGTPPHTSLGGYQTSGAPFLAFPGPGGKTIFAKSVAIPARPILPTSKLPTSWGQDIKNAINGYLTGT